MVSESGARELQKKISYYWQNRVVLANNESCVSYFECKDYTKISAFFRSDKIYFVLELSNGFRFYMDDVKKADDGTLEYYRDGVLIGYDAIKKDKKVYRF